ncbi:hypothetical protein D3C71_2006330 [compost metagenome]
MHTRHTPVYEVAGIVINHIIHSKAKSLSISAGGMARSGVRGGKGFSVPHFTKLATFPPIKPAKSAVAK